MNVDVVDTQGKVVGSAELDETVWGIEPNIPVMHQALLRQLANARLGTRDTKTRGEVRGGGAKPWRQKGTGRARQGSIRSTEAELEKEGSRSFWGEALESWREGNLVGTPEQVCEKIQTYVDLGCTGFIPWCPDYPSTETMELFAKHVMPQFR